MTGDDWKDRLNPATRRQLDEWERRRTEERMEKRTTDWRIVIACVVGLIVVGFCAYFYPERLRAFLDG